MKELRTDTKKRLMWLLAEAARVGGQTTIERNTTYPGFDAAIVDENEIGVELQLKPAGEHYLQSDWAFRVIIMKDVLAEELPVYATMWRDTENGLNHLVNWISGLDGDDQQTPDLMAPAEFYDSAVGLINHHVSRLWILHNLPALKHEFATQTS
jgi:hypothetical protein